MYIFELFAKLKKDFGNKTGIFSKKSVSIQKEVEKCSHVFVPIDSTEKILACSKCGLIIHKEKLDKFKNPNFFNKD
ncbi:MAG: hypothetical protein E7Z91_04540 [Cyanobacteria bacterium SIG30]|nr:hypothetical protein [Cyanobacteria bacterium SIG30]